MATQLAEEEAEDAEDDDEEAVEEAVTEQEKLKALALLHKNKVVSPNTWKQ